MKVFIISIFYVILTNFIWMFIYSATRKKTTSKKEFYNNKEWRNVMDNLRIRGFEKISEEQFMKDFEGIDVKYEDIKMPKRGTKWSAGYDIFTPIKIELEPGQDIKIPTGLKVYMRPDEYLAALPRSGQGFKYYLRLANTEGVIDADYRFSDNEGHFYVKIRNEGHEKVVIEKGVGICQVIFKKYLLVDGDSTEIGAERNGGFGSTTKGGI